MAGARELEFSPQLSEKQSKTWLIRTRSLTRKGSDTGMLSTDALNRRTYLKAFSKSGRIQARIVASGKLISTSFNAFFQTMTTQCFGQYVYPNVPRFEFLKSFLIDPTMQSMEIEAFHVECEPQVGSRITCHQLISHQSQIYIIPIYLIDLSGNPESAPKPSLWRSLWMSFKPFTTQTGWTRRWSNAQISGMYSDLSCLQARFSYIQHVKEKLFPFVGFAQDYMCCKLPVLPRPDRPSAPSGQKSVCEIPSLIQASKVSQVPTEHCHVELHLVAKQLMLCRLPKLRMSAGPHKWCQTHLQSFWLHRRYPWRRRNYWHWDQGPGEGSNKQGCEINCWRDADNKGCC